MRTPREVRVRMYQVGFGDCFLVSFYYSRKLEDGRAVRHMLVDFGSTRYPKRGFELTGVAERISSDCDELDVLVVSHRHKDHLSGFGIAGPAAVIDSLKPKLVVRSWTEDPEAAVDATGVTRVDEASLRFTTALAGGQTLADALFAQLQTERRGLRGELATLVDHQTLAAVGEEDLSNAKAYARLTGWGEAGAQEFLFFGARSRIPEFIPGIRVRVLGPPTVDQHHEVTGARAQDPEYWMLHEALLREFSTTAELYPDRRSVLSKAEMGAPPGPVRWLVGKMQRQHMNNLLRIVRELDDALNNTSLILMIDAGDKRILFPGDAQIENWNYALKVSEEGDGLDAGGVRRLLAGVDLYKVGHHGSRNATPRTLLETVWGADDHDLVALMGTKKGVHGKVESTAVPRETLVQALLERTGKRLWSTASLPDREDAVVEVRARTRGGHPFEYTGPDDIPEPIAVAENRGGGH